jgi:hypothetical protein
VKKKFLRDEALKKFNQWDIVDIQLSECHDNDDVDDGE